MGIANIINNSTTTSGGEIVRELVNSSDGQGLHFDGSAGNIDIATPPDLGTAFSFEFVIKADSWPASGSNIYIVDFGNGGRFVLGNPTTGNFSVRSVTGDWISFGSAVLDDLKVHHIVVTVDGTSAIAYDNGNQIGTATINSPNIDSCADARIGSDYVGTASFFNGTIYRARFYNKTLTSAEVQTAFERADVDFADQYGSQTSLVDAGASVFTSGTYSWSAYGSNTIANVGNALEITYVNHAYGASNGLRDSSDLTTDLTVGKKYRLTVDAKYTGGSAGSKLQLSLAGSNTDFATLTTSLVTYTYEFTTDTAAGGGLRMSGMSAGNVVTIDNWYLREIGCVSDYDLAFANPTQSLTVQDRAGSADGTCSASGVTQVQPIIQGNMRSLAVTTSQQAAGVPADGDIVATGQIKTAGGALATPSFAITNEAGLGMSRPTSNTLNFITASTERMRIDGSGNVTVSGPKLEVTDDLASAHTILKLKNTNAAAGYGSQIQLEDHDSKYYISIVDSDLKFFNGATTTVNFANSGLATFSAGVNLGNSASATGTTLDHYEEGTWTPAFSVGAISGSNITYTGRYTRIGKLVYIYCKIAATANDLVIGNYVGLSGLPFTAAASASGFSTTEDIDLDLGGEVNIGSTTIFFGATGSATSTQTITATLTYEV